MPARLLSCPACHRTLGTVSRKHDHRGKPVDILRRAENAVRVEWVLFRGTCIECRCGERVPLPDHVKPDWPR